MLGTQPCSSAQQSHLAAAWSSEGLEWTTPAPLHAPTWLNGHNLRTMRNRQNGGQVRFWRGFVKEDD